MVLNPLGASAQDVDVGPSENFIELPQFLPSVLTNQQTVLMRLVFGNCVFVSNDPAMIDFDENQITVRIGYGAIGDPTCSGSNTRYERDIELGQLEPGQYQLDLIGVLTDSGNVDDPIYSDIMFGVAAAARPIPATSPINIELL